MSNKSERRPGPYPEQQQDVPGTTDKMDPKPDHGEESYKGSGRLAGKCAVITGGDSGIGRAVAIAFAREGADVLVSYLCEDEDAKNTAALVKKAGRRCELVAGDISEASHCQKIIQSAVEAFGRIDILVNNAAHQMTFGKLEEIADEEWEKTFVTNIHAMFYLAKAALPHMREGSAIINTASINSDKPNPMLPPRARSRTSPPDWQNCWRTRRSA